MSMNWRERFLQTKTACSNVQPEIDAIFKQATDYRNAQEQERRNNVGANGAITKFCRINASIDQNYPASAKWNFAIIDSEGRKRYLTPLECEHYGFDFIKGTSQVEPFLKNLADPFYLAYARAESAFHKKLNETYWQQTERAYTIQKQHQDKPWRWPLYQQYLQSKEWAQKKKPVLFRDNHCCQLCGEVENLNVHHLTYNRVGDEALFDLVTLCRYHHDIEHGKRDTE